MKVHLVSIGDELLLGQTINTNAAWLGEQLSLIGGDIHKCVTIKDTEEEIINSLEDSFNSDSDVIIITGGLGPTKDDITKHTLCKFFNTELVLNNDVLEHVEGFFRQYNKPMLDVNRLQAYLPKNSTILKNENGTAPGMWFEKDGKIVISLPGVPYEMKGIMVSSGFSNLKNKFSLKSFYFEMIYTQGIGESYLAERIEDIETSMREEGISLAYLPSPGSVRLRLSSPDDKLSKSKISNYSKRISERLPQYVYSINEESLSAVVGKLLSDKGLTVGTVESCTAGGVANELTKIAGASSYYMGSFLTYSYDLKMKLVDVQESDLNKFGAVSEEVVRQMAEGGRKKLDIDYCIAISGIAGPDGGTKEKPIGTVWFAISSKKGVLLKKMQFGKDRGRNVKVSILTALNLLRCELLEINLEKS